MKKLFLLIGVITLLFGCMPMKISQHEKNHWRNRKKIVGYYYRTYPIYQKKRIKQKAYIPYFRNGKY